MSGELNEISQAIGALQADGRTAALHREAMTNTLANVSEKIDKLLPLVKKVEAMEADVQNYRDLRNKGIGILAGIGLAGGSIGAAVNHWIAKW